MHINTLAFECLNIYTDQNKFIPTFLGGIKKEQKYFARFFGCTIDIYKQAITLQVVFQASAISLQRYLDKSVFHTFPMYKKVI